MKIILDTNCFISSIGKKSVYRKVFDSFLDGKFILCVSTEILFEYEEKFSEFWGVKVANNIMGVLLTANNVTFHSVFYNFHMVEGDKDDNKFSDCYLSSGADILVSNDSQLLALNKNVYPPVAVMSLEEFMNSFFS